MKMSIEVAAAPQRIECAENAARSGDQTILVLLNTYLPGYKAGGPIRSIQNLIAALGQEFHFRVVTSDRDLGDKFPFPGIAANRWVRVGHAEVMYLPPGLLGFLGMYALLRSVDRSTVLYLNSFLAVAQPLPGEEVGARATRRILAGSVAAQAHTKACIYQDLSVVWTVP